MDKHIMESLLMDQALDALSPETEQLLQAYLSDHPEFQPLSEAICEIAMLGQKAVAAEMPTEMPRFPRERLSQKPRQAGWPSVRRWKTIAACILLGMGIGFSLRQLVRIDSRPGSTVVATQAQAETTRLPESVKVTRAFWSVKTYQTRYKTYPTSTRTKTDLLRYKNYGKGGLL